MKVEIQSFFDRCKIAIPQDVFIGMMKAQLKGQRTYELSESEYQTIKSNYNKIYGKVL